MPRHGGMRVRVRVLNARRQELSSVVTTTEVITDGGSLVKMLEAVGTDAVIRRLRDGSFIEYTKESA